MGILSPIISAICSPILPWLRASGDVPTNARLLENGSARLMENGTYRLTE